MKAETVLSKLPKITISLFCSLAMLTYGISQAAPLPAETQAKVEKYKKMIVEWAANPMIIAAVKDSNSKGGVAGMNNAKWDDLADNSPVVAGLSQSAVAKQLAQWEEGKSMEKLILRDDKANLVAYSQRSGKPLLFNSSSRPSFTIGIKGTWDEGVIKPDPTTQKKTIQIATPVMDGGKAIGLLHSSVLAE